MNGAKTVEELVAMLQALPNQKANLSRPLWIAKDTVTYKSLAIGIIVIRFPFVKRILIWMTMIKKMEAS